VNKVYRSAAEAVIDIHSGSSLAVGGFGLCGIPSALISALADLGVSELEIVSNNCGVDGLGLGVLLAAKRIRRITSSYVGENREFERQFLAGELEVELIPQGSLAEKLRAGGAGIPAFYTPAGIGTLIAEGGIPWRMDSEGNTSIASPPKEIREFDGAFFILEMSIRTNFSLVHARYGDYFGNLIYEKSAQNFNPLCAQAGHVTIAEVEELVEPGDLDPREVHTPGIYVQRVVHVSDTEKSIEKKTLRT